MNAAKTIKMISYFADFHVVLRYQAIVPTGEALLIDDIELSPKPKRNSIELATATTLA